MKKTILLFVVIFCVIISSGQQALKPLLTPSLDKAQVMHLSKEKSLQELKSFGNILWEEDFGSGLTSLNTWTMVDQTSNNHVFIWSDSPVPGPNGEWVAGISPFTSTTVANGYLCLPADEYNVAFSPNYVDMESYAQLPVMNFTGEDAVTITFEQYFRYCCGNTQRLELQVSNDGSNWTEYDVSSGVSTNAPSPNPDVVMINISSVAANQSTVYIRFFFSDVSHYFWAIDDIKIIEGAKHDLKIEESYIMSVTDLGASGTSYNGYYSRLPISQVMPMVFWASVFNNGSMAQSNVEMQAPILLGNNPIGTSTASVSLLASDSTEEMVGNTFIPTATGYYSAFIEVTADSTDEYPIDNITETVNWIVDSNQVLARDFYYSGNLGPANFTGGNDGDFMGNTFTVSENAEVESASFYISNETVPGTILIAQMYHEDGGNRILQIQSEEYIITPSDTGGWINIPFVAISPGDNDVIADESYIVGAEFYWGGGTDELSVGVDSEGPHQYWLASNLRIGTDWYWINYIPKIRMNLVGATFPPQFNFFPWSQIQWLYGSSSSDTSLYISVESQVGYPATLQAVSLPSFATFNNNGDGTGTLNISVSQADVSPNPYTITFVASNGRAESTMSFDFWVVEYNPVVETPLDDVKIYPNPNSGTLIIENTQGSSITVMNILGEVLSTITQASDLQYIDLQKLQPGTYIIHIRNGKHARSERIIKIN